MKFSLYPQQKPYWIVALSSIFVLLSSMVFAQLAINKSVNVTTAGANSPVIYTIQYNCQSITNPCNNVVVTDQLPLGLTNAIITTAIGSGNWNPGTNLVTVNLGDLAAGTTGDITISTFVGTSAAPGTILKNTATICSNGANCVTSNEVTTTVLATPSINYFKNLNRVDGTPTSNVIQGQSYIFGYYWGNNGNVALNDVCISDVLPNPDKLIVSSIETGHFDGISGNVLNVQYQTNLNASWTSLPGSPFDPSGTGNSIPISSLGLASGEHITQIRWCFTIPLPAGVQSSGNVGPGYHFSSTIDAPLGPNTNCLVFSSSNGPTTQPACRPFTVVQPITTAIPGVYKVNNKYYASAGDTIHYQIRIENNIGAAQAMKNAAVFDDYVTNALQFLSWRMNTGFTGTQPTATFTPNYSSQYGTPHSKIKWQFSSDIAVGERDTIFVDFIVKKAALGFIPNYGYITADNSTPGICGYESNSIQDIWDVDGDGNTSEILCVSNSSSNIQVDASSLLTSEKLVKGQCDQFYSKYPAFGKTMPGGLADYRLRVRNDGNVPMKDIKIIDILPFIGDNGVLDPQTRLTQWRPNLAGPVTPPTGVTVYYSTESNPCRVELGYSPAGCTGPSWSLTPPADITTVQSLKFDFGSIIINPGDSLILSWPMRAPVNAPTNDEIAWNSFGFVGTRTDNNVALLPAEPIKVGIKLKPLQPAIYGDYVWLDTNKNGIQDDGQTGVSGVRVNLYKDNGNGLADPNTDLFIGFTVTDGNGQYLFPSLQPGDYFAVFAPPAGYVVAPSLQGGDATKDSEGIITAITRLDAGEDDRTWDLGIYLSPTCDLKIANYTISPCQWNGTSSEVTVNVFVAWANAPAGQNIDVVLNGVTKTVNVTGGATSPAMVSFTMPANNTNYTINAAFNGTASCNASQVIHTPLPCQPNTCTLNLDAVNVSACANGKATVDVVVSWSGAPTGENIVVTIGDSTRTILVASGALSPTTVSVTVLGNGATNKPISASFVTTTTCKATGSYNTPNCVCVKPNAISLTKTAPTCAGLVAQNNGKITLVSATGADRWGISTAGAASYDGPAYTAPANTYSANTDVKTNILNTGGKYILRLFNGSNDCFKDTTITVTPITCWSSPILACGMAIGTCGADPDFSPTGVLNGNYTASSFVIGVMDIRQRPAFSPTVNWAPSIYHHPDWIYGTLNPTTGKTDKLGGVFGIATDKNGNIYTTTFKPYGVNGIGNNLNAAPGFGGDGAIYKLDGISGNVSVLANLPQSSNAAQLGNIAYDKDNNRFFASNLDDGKIYVISSTGTVGGTPFDYGVADNGAAGPAGPGERVWGIAYRNGRVYYSRWLGSGQSNEIRSVAVDASGIFSGDQLEFTNPQSANVSSRESHISDIEFAEDGKLLMAERTMDETQFISHAHYARSFEYEYNGSAWSLTHTYYVGDVSPPIGLLNAHSAGGVAYGYNSVNVSTNIPTGIDEIVWTSGDYLNYDATNYIFGFQGIARTGNTSGAPTANANLIDANGNTSGDEKWAIGDIDVFHCEVCVKPNAGPDQMLVCAAVAPSTADLVDAVAGQKWKVLKVQPNTNVTVTTPAGAVAGMTVPGLYQFVLQVQSSDSLTCRDTVNVTVPDCSCPTVNVLTSNVMVCKDSLFPTLSVTITGSNTTGVTAAWYANATGGSVLTTGLSYKPAGTATVTDTFYVQLNGVTQNCQQNPRTPVIVTVQDCKKTVDLALKKLIDKKVAKIGDILTFTIKVWNESNNGATGVEVVDSIATTVQFQAGSFAASKGSATITGNVIKWIIGNIAANGDTVTLTYQVKATQEGVHFNTAQICKANEEDTDSTPCNNIEDEDDIDRQCFTVPFKLCPNQQIEVSVPTKYTNVQWFKNGGTTVVATGNAVLFTEVGTYTFTATNNTCPASGCCPVIIEPGDNCCPVDLCVPFTIKQTKKAGKKL